PQQAMAQVSLTNRTVCVGVPARQQQVQITVVVVVDEGDAGGPVLRGEAGGGSHVLKFAFAQIAEEQHAIFQRNGEIVEAITIEVANSAGDGVTRSFESGSVGIEVRKRAVAVRTKHTNGMR